MKNLLPCYYLSALTKKKNKKKKEKKRINMLTVDWQQICFVSFFILASLFSMEMDSRVTDSAESGSAALTY